MGKRTSGLLLHLTSLPSPFGIGDLGPSAYQWVDFLSKAGVKAWQLLPLNPTDPVFGNSPYSSHSAFAMNVLFVSPEFLVRDGWLAPEDLADKPCFGDDYVDYPAVSRYKEKILARAVTRFAGKDDKAFAHFVNEQSFWLDDYAAFVVLKRVYGDRLWNQWPEEIRRRDPAALQKVKDSYGEQIRAVKFSQFLVASQFQFLRRYCAKKGVSLIGDIPIYVSSDSVDVWANPELFKLAEDLSPVYVAGVPPDYFSKTGQRWGNPVYDWPKNKGQGYAWWIRHNLSLFDEIRVDHFRGFAGYWEIPAAEATAVNGRWSPGPGEDLFQQLKKNFSPLPIIAEDLGIITPDVTALMEKFSFPGMKILLFAFSGETKTHPYIPENYLPHCVAYTGTHDNNTARGWFEEDASLEEKKNLFAYLGAQVPAGKIARHLVDLVMRSAADLAIIPLQDYLGLGAPARMNTPGKTHGNWAWRFSREQISPEITQEIATIVKSTQRG